MNIIVNNKITAGLVSIVLTTLVLVSFVPVNAQEQSIEELQATLASLTAQLSALEGGAGPTVNTVNVASTGNAACPFTWSRNLTIGSTGDDVLRLQRFLNGNPSTQVAVSGAGSPGNETRYYGPITATAVSKFQELHAAQVLTPLGLSKGTGGFYASTRKRANEVCSVVKTVQQPIAPINNTQVTPVTPTTPKEVVSVSGDAVAITAGPRIADAFALKGAQRVPFTSFVLTAGNDSVSISNIRVRRYGLSSSDNFDSVAIVDTDGIQYGSSKRLNSKDEAIVGTGISLQARESKTFAVVGNITSTEEDINSGATAGIEIYEVSADTSVSGLSDDATIRGATHIISTAINLQKVEVKVENQTADIDLNEATEVVEIDIDLKGVDIAGNNADEEDAYLKSIILKQKGSADNSEIGEVAVLIDGDYDRSADVKVSGDLYAITFEGKGVKIKEGKDVKVSLEVTTEEGSTETIRFELDDTNTETINGNNIFTTPDVYIVGATTGYGLPVEVSSSGTDPNIVALDGSDTSKESTIKAGTVERGSRIKDFEDKVKYGDNVVIGALSVEFEGEDIEIEDLTFELTLSNIPTDAFTDANISEISISDIELRVDGDSVSSASDTVEILATDVSSGTATATVEFEERFTVDVRNNRDVKFEIVADLEDDWSYFDGTRIEFVLNNVAEAEGVISEEDYTTTGRYFASARTFEDVTVKGNDVNFEINNDGVLDANFVGGTDGVVFATFEVDNVDSTDDVEVDNLYITVTPAASADLDHLDSCELTDSEGERVADQRGSINGTSADLIRFRFDDVTVDSGEKEVFDIRCDIDSQAVVGGTYQFGQVDGDRVEYRISGDRNDYSLVSNDSSDLITIATSGSIRISFDSLDDETTKVIAVGNSAGKDGVEIVEIEIEAESEDITITDIYLAGISLIGTTDRAMFDKVIDSTRITLGNTRGEDFSATGTETPMDAAGTAGTPVTITNSIKFEDVSETIEADEEERFTLEFDFSGINDRDGTAGQIVSADKIVVVWKGDDSRVKGVTEKNLSADFAKIRVFPSVPIVTTTERTQNLSATNNRKLYEFSVAADEKGDIYLGQVAFEINMSDELTLTNLKLRRGSTELGTGTVSSGSAKIALTNPEEISAGSSETFSLHADVGGTVDDRASVNVSLKEDNPSTLPTVVGQEHAAALTAGNFVWSPNALEKDGATTSNLDWFNGYAVFKSGDIQSWSNER